MFIVFSFIPGFMIGIEFPDQDQMIVIDLFILRVMVFYGKEKPEF
jgi:hypothetical protein